MSLQLYMVGLFVNDMGKAQEFYRRLGVGIPASSESEPHVEIKMGEDFTFFLNSRAIPPEQRESGTMPPTSRVIFEYYLKSQAAVEAKYAELIAYGYESYHAPFRFPANNMCFALVNDPDGNTILLSGDLEQAAEAQTRA
jgi:predicted lactoylglutathione lyase